jgi:hypothetical protein
MDAKYVKFTELPEGRHRHEIVECPALESFFQDYEELCKKHGLCVQAWDVVKVVPYKQEHVDEIKRANYEPEAGVRMWRAYASLIDPEEG